MTRSKFIVSIILLIYVSIITFRKFIDSVIIIVTTVTCIISVVFVVFVVFNHHYNLRFFFLFPILPHIFSLGNLLTLRQHIKALAVRCHRQRTVIMRRQHLSAKMR